MNHIMKNLIIKMSKCNMILLISNREEEKMEKERKNIIRIEKISEKGKVLIK